MSSRELGTDGSWLKSKWSTALLPLSMLLAAAACGDIDEEAPVPSVVAQHAKQGTEPDGPATMTAGDFQHKARQPYATRATGDFDGDGTTDVFVSVPGPSGVGIPTSGDLWIGLSDGDGDISVVKHNNNYFSSASYILVGDYNGDGKDDLINFFRLLLDQVGEPDIWQSDGTGYFVGVPGPHGNGTEIPHDFLEWMFLWPSGGVRMLSCDIDGDKKSDIVLTGPNDWDTIPIAFSNGDGSFHVTNFPIWYFHDWAEDQNAKLACDDFDGDGDDDLIVLGGAGWNTVPVAFSNRDGTFTVTNYVDPFWSTWGTQVHTQLVTGDVDGDKCADIIMTGGLGWSTVRVGKSSCNGHFGASLTTTVGLQDWAQEPQSIARGGDFNGDGLGDFTLLGGADYWFTLPIGISNGDQTFTTLNQPVP